MLRLLPGPRSAPPFLPSYLAHPDQQKKTGKQNLEYVTTFFKFDVGLGNNLTPKIATDFWVNPSTPTRTPRSLLSPHLHLQEDVILSMFHFNLKDRS